jgi:hypothetical protein
MKFRLKTKIRYDGREYSDPNELPPEVRTAYEKALRSDATHPAAAKIVFNDHEYADPSEMPDGVRRLCEDVMSVIENNGEVTLPIFSAGGPRVTKGQRRIILLVIGAVILATLVVLATR